MSSAHSCSVLGYGVLEWGSLILFVSLAIGSNVDLLGSVLSSPRVLVCHVRTLAGFVNASVHSTAYSNIVPLFGGHLRAVFVFSPASVVYLSKSWGQAAHYPRRYSAVK